MAKIMVVDDEPSMLDVLCTLLRSQGHEVFPYSGGDKAIEMMLAAVKDKPYTPAKTPEWPNRAGMGAPDVDKQYLKK